MPNHLQVYSRTSFSRNWCEAHWPELHPPDEKVLTECFQTYEWNSGLWAKSSCIKFCAHYIAAIPDLVDIRYDLNDDVAWESAIERLAVAAVDQIFHTLGWDQHRMIDFKAFSSPLIKALGLDESKNWKDKLAFTFDNENQKPRNTRPKATGKHGSFPRSKNKPPLRRANARRGSTSVQTISDVLAQQASNKGALEEPSASTRQERIEQFFRKLKTLQRGKPPREGGGRGALGSDDAITYTRIFEDLIVFYPVGKLIREYHQRVSAHITDILQKEPSERTEEELKSIAKKMGPALESHKIVPIYGMRALAAVREVRLQKFKAEEVVFHKGNFPHRYFIIFEGSVAVFNGSLNEGRHVATLQSGTGFGGLALATGEKQQTTTVCVEDVIMGYLTSKSYKELMQPSYEPNPRPKYIVLRQCPLLKFTPVVLLKELSLLATTKQFKRGELILQQGEKPEDGVYFIRQGTIQLLRELPPKPGTRECVFAHVDTLGPTQSFGWESLLSNFEALCSAVAVDSVSCFVINKPNLLHKLDNRSLQCVYDAIVTFPSDEELAHTLKLSSEWMGYRQNVFDEVRLGRRFRTEQMQVLYPGSTTTFLNVPEFRLMPEDTLDVHMRPQRQKENTRMTPETGWRRVKHVICIDEETNQARKSNKIAETLLSIAQKAKTQDRLVLPRISESGKGKSAVMSQGVPIPKRGSKVAVVSGNMLPSLLQSLQRDSASINYRTQKSERPKTPRSFRIQQQRQKRKKKYIRNNIGHILHIPGYSWLTMDTEKSVYRAFRDARRKWMQFHQTM